jgi:tetratricopeptide (TPR) repeat protein
MDDVVKKYAVENITLTESNESSVSIEDIYDLIGRGKYSKAAKQLRALAPDEAWRQAGFEEVQFRFEYGRAMSECGKLSKAVTELEKALALDPDHAEALFQLGLSKHRLGFPGEAKADIDRALTRLTDPETFRARYESERLAEA